MVKLHYRKLGSGPNLVILHGLYGSSDNWLTIAKKLEGHFTIWLPDHRNHGQSQHTDSHSYKDMVEDVAEFFHIHKIESANLLGHSMGGKVAMLFAAEYPEKTNSLIVVDIAPKSYISPEVTYKHVKQHELILQLISDLDLSSITTRTEIDQYFAEKLSDIGLRLFLLKNIHRNKDGHFAWKINVPVLRNAIESIVNDVNETIFSDRMPITAYPVTFIRGLDSDYISDEDIVVIKSIYPDAHIIDIPGAGHWLHAEQPENFITALLSAVM
jgi:pimeloyl-ACP methyl ester carboxylesterase